MNFNDSVTRTIWTCNSSYGSSNDFRRLPTFSIIQLLPTHWLHLLIFKNKMNVNILHLLWWMLFYFKSLNSRVCSKEGYGLWVFLTFQDIFTPIAHLDNSGFTVHTVFILILFILWKSDVIHSEPLQTGSPWNHEENSQPSGPGRVLVIPLEGCQVVVVQFSEGVDQMGTEVRVDVFRHKLSDPWSVLRPVGVVAHSPLAWGAGTSTS